MSAGELGRLGGRVAQLPIWRVVDWGKLIVEMASVRQVPTIDTKSKHQAPNFKRRWHCGTSGAMADTAPRDSVLECGSPLPLCDDQRLNNQKSSRRLGGPGFNPEMRVARLSSCESSRGLAHSGTLRAATGTLNSRARSAGVWFGEAGMPLLTELEGCLGLGATSISPLNAAGANLSDAPARTRVRPGPGRSDQKKL